MKSPFEPLTEQEFPSSPYEEVFVAVTQPSISVTSNNVRYGDVAALLAGKLPEPPAPSVLRRSDGNSVFYDGQVNMMFGEPESGKTFVALAAVSEVLNNGGKASCIDLDHNGMASTVTRLLALGVPKEILADLERFRYVEPEDSQDFRAIVKDLAVWCPDVAVIDSIGELMSIAGFNSNSPDDFTAAHTHFIKPLAKAGACVIAIDHVAKNPDSKAQGPTGTAAKSRAIGGSSIRVTVKDAFTPGKGGSCYLAIRKDRHGGLRATSPAGDKEPLAGTFKLNPEGHQWPWTLWAPESGDKAPEAVPAADLADLRAMDPQPANVREVMERLKWGSHRATVALRVYRDQLLPVTETQGPITVTPPVTRNADVTEQQATLNGVEAA